MWPMGPSSRSCCPCVTNPRKCLESLTPQNACLLLCTCVPAVAVSIARKVLQTRAHRHTAASGDTGSHPYYTALRVVLLHDPRLHCVRDILALTDPENQAAQPPARSVLSHTSPNLFDGLVWAQQYAQDLRQTSLDPEPRQTLLQQALVYVAVHCADAMLGSYSLTLQNMPPRRRWCTVLLLLLPMLLAVMVPPFGDSGERTVQTTPQRTATPPTAKSSCAAGAGLLRFEHDVVRVIDGDTLVLHALYLPLPIAPEIRLRIRGVDTPELGGRAGYAEEAALGEQARRFVETIVCANSPHGYVVSLHGCGEYAARVIGDVHLLRTGQRLSELLVVHALAVPYTGRGARHDWCTTPTTTTDE